MMAQTIDVLTGVLQQQRDGLARARAGLANAEQLSDTFIDKLQEFDRIRRASREMLEATTSVNHEVMKIVSDNLRELIEKTPDPDAPWMRPAITTFGRTLVRWNRQVSACEERVRQCEAALRAAREEEA
jgi:uncharacterized protein YukE